MVEITVHKPKIRVFNHWVQGEDFVFFEKRLGMVSVPCIVDNSNGFLLFYSKSLQKKIPVCFGSFRNSSVCFGCFDKGSKHWNKPKFFFLVSRNKPKQTRNRSCFGLFRFEPKNLIFHFEDTLGASQVPSSAEWRLAEYGLVQRSSMLCGVEVLYSISMPDAGRVVSPASALICYAKCRRLKKLT